MAQKKSPENAVTSTPPPAAPAAPPRERPSPQPPADPEATRLAAVQQAVEQGERIRERVVPACLATALGMDNQFDVNAYRAYLLQVVNDIGPTDPIERMMCEQLAFAHLRIAQLHALGGPTASIEATKILTAATSRLLSEFRRLAVTIKQMRRPPQADAPVKSKRKAKAKRVRLAQAS